MVIIIGKLNDENVLAGHTACVNNTMVFFMFNLSVTITANAVLAKSVSEGNKNQARNIIKLALTICGTICLAISISGYLLEGLMVKLFCIGEEMKASFLMSYRFLIFFYFIGDFF